MSKTEETVPPTDAQEYEPGRIGYWARVHDLDWDDVCEDEDLRKYLDAYESPHYTARERFEDGWNDADVELRCERLDALRGSLKE